MQKKTFLNNIYLQLLQSRKGVTNTTSKIVSENIKWNNKNVVYFELHPINQTSLLQEATKEKRSELAKRKTIKIEIIFSQPDRDTIQEKRRT